MDKRLNQLLDRNTESFDDWIDILNQHSKLWFTENETSNENAFQITHKTVTVLSQIASIFYQYGNFKDEFDDGHYYQNMYGPELLINSNKTKTKYQLGINDRGIYLSSYLMNAEYLRNMDDQFWSDVIKLSDYKDFELIEFDYCGREVKQKYPDLCYNYKGVVFKIFRKYFFGMTEYEGQVHDFGSWKVTWAFSSDFQTIIAEGCEVFKLFYKLNYELWKVGDLKKKMK